MGSSSRAGAPLNHHGLAKRLSSTVQTISRAVDSALSLLPDGVPDPQYIAKGNKVRCMWCGATYKTRAKYVSHWHRSHDRE